MVKLRSQKETGDNVIKADEKIRKSSQLNDAQSRKASDKPRKALKPINTYVSKSLDMDACKNNAVSQDSSITCPEPQTPSKKRKMTSNTPKTRTPSSVIQEAKSAFRRCATPSKLVGRDSERLFLRSFLLKHVKEQKSGSLYISGVPGTGKTALLNEVLRDLQFEFQKLEFSVKQAFVNCMAVKDSKDIFEVICDAFSFNFKTGDSLKTLKLKFNSTSSNSTFVLTLDEIDQLLSQDQNTLYTLFELAKAPNSKLILIGIANALDLTTRFLPRLQSKNVAPELLVFNPYKVNEITNIIKSRLLSLEDPDDEISSPTKKGFLDQNFKGKVPLMHPMAIELTARKIADSGDLRKALDAIEVAESELNSKAQASKEPTILHAPIKTLDEVPNVTIKHVLAATNTILGSQTTKRISELQMQAKMLLLTLVIMTKVGRKDFVFWKAYSTLCKHNNHIDPVQDSEFKDLSTLLESQGLLRLESKKGKDDSANKIFTLLVNAHEVESAVSNSPLLKEVMENGLKVLKL